MTTPLILIVGTSSAIGQATALACAKAGYGVVATVREIDRMADLEQAAQSLGIEMHIEQLDVTSEGVGDKVRELLLKYGPIEGLVNNAAIVVGGAFEEQSERDVRDQFETNLFGALEVTRALLPSLRALGSGCIVNVSSISARVGLPMLAPYSAACHALVGFSDALRHELAPFGIAVCLLELGNLRTPMFLRSRRRGELVTEASPYADLMRSMHRLLADSSRGGPEPEVVAAKIVELLSMSSPPFRTVVGGEARAMAALHHVVPDVVFTTGLRRIIGLP